jgi:hexosaminidase
MIQLTKLFILSLLVLSCSKKVKYIDKEVNINIVPLPKKVDIIESNKYILLPKNIKVFIASDEKKNLFNLISKDFGKLSFSNSFKLIKNKNRANLSLEIADELDKEEYEITVSNKIVIKGGSLSAIKMARSTLLQLSENDKGRVIFPIIKLKDNPDADYRGLLIDLARKWHKAETIYKLIDLASFYKLNYLQFHLTDDQLFTFPSENFPKLQTKDKHYTKEELLSFVDYAYQRGVVIVPEIDVPGHSMQFVKKYPEIFSISNAESGGEDLFGGRVDFVNVLNMGKEEVYTSLEKLFIEVMDIFHTSPYFHLGADEANLKLIVDDPDVKRFMKKNNLGNDVHELYRYFIVRMNDFFKSKGKQMFVWEGFSRNGKIEIPRDITVFEFESLYNLPNHLVEDGYKLVNTSWKPLYVVRSGNPDPNVLPLKWGPERIYEWNMWRWETWWHKSPAYKKPIQLDRNKNVIGAQMCSWEQTDESEVPSLRKRLPSFVERIWNVDKKVEFDVFFEKVNKTDIVLSEIINDKSQDSLLIGFNIIGDGNGNPIKEVLD